MKKVLTFPNVLLRKKSKDVDMSNDKEVKEIKRLIEDMKKTMYESNGIGLAAPQLGITKRLFIIDIEQTVETDDEGDVISRIPGQLHVFINPKFISKEGEILYEEGCLSVPGIYEEVKRSRKVEIEYYDSAFEPKVMTAEGIMAVVAQHEYDHLDGKLFIDKLSVVKRSMIKKKIIKGKNL